MSTNGWSKRVKQRSPLKATNAVPWRRENSRLCEARGARGGIRERQRERERERERERRGEEEREKEVRDREREAVIAPPLCAEKMAVVRDGECRACTCSDSEAAFLYTESVPRIATSSAIKSSLLHRSAKSSGNHGMGGLQTLQCRALTDRSLVGQRSAATTCRHYHWIQHW